MRISTRWSRDAIEVSRRPRDTSLRVAGRPASSHFTAGFLSCAHWLQWRTGVDPGTAREKVRVARALASLPLVSAAMQRGELSYAKVRAITRIATAENEAALVDAARAGTASHIERLVRAWRRVDRMEAARQTERRHLHRELAVSPK